MLRRQVKFSLAFSIIFFIHLQHGQAGRVRCDSECLENKLDEVLERLKVFTETYTIIPDMQSVLANRPRSPHISGNPIEDYYNPPKQPTYFKRSNSIITPPINDDDTSDTNNKCSERLAGICEKAGVREIQVDDMKILPFNVLCDTERWMIVMQRLDGSVAFNNRTWDMYKKGFGNIDQNKEFFLGLQHIHELTFNGLFELRIDMEDYEGVQKYAHYSDFSIFDEQSGYKIGLLGVYDGTAGDSFMYHEGQQFSTLDRDNDVVAQGSCSEQYNSAGWFKNCMEANIFGKYMREETDEAKQGMYWETFHGPEYSLKEIRMSIRAKC